MTTPASIEICPISGFSILRKPEWNDVGFGGTYRANISVLGERIIVSRPSGYVRLNGVKWALSLIESIVSETVGQNSPYILIEDLVNLKGNSIEARRYYISHMKKRNALLGLIFCNISTFSKISYKLGRRLNVAPFEVEMVDTYSDAVNLALDNLKRNLLHTEKAPGANVVGQWQGLPATSDGKKLPTVRRGFDEMGYSLELEMIHGDILHSVSKGFMGEMHVPRVNQCRQEIFDAIQPGGRMDYFIASVVEFSGVDPKARILYMNSVKRWYERHPFKMMILYGSNRLVRTAINLARPFMPFKVRTATDMKSALLMVALDKREAEDEKFPLDEDAPALKSTEVLTHEQYVDELLGYIAQIRWDSESPEFSFQDSAASSHPLSAVFDAILLIKSEMDQLFKERESANKALMQARDGLERRVAERTKELIVLNRKLREEIEGHKKTLEELEKSNQELKETQSQLIQSAKLASIGELASGVAHELNQPLMVVRTTNQLLQKKLDPDHMVQGEVAVQLELAKKNTKRMMNIIKHLGLFSRQSDRDFEPVDINGVIEDSLLMIGEQLRVREIGVKKALTPDLAMVLGNSNHLEQVILNFLTNARDAIEEYGASEENRKRAHVIEIKTGISLTEPGFVEILIRDSGSGISPHAGQKIFDPFFTTKEVGKGTGLGLSISYGIIKEHQGEIEVLETGPEGTTFRVRLPIRNPAIYTAESSTKSVVRTHYD